MRKLINNIIKALIITSVKSNATWPLVYIYSKVIREVKSTQNKSNAKQLTFLVLTPERFRGDLEVLADTNKFRILSLPCNWQYKILRLSSSH
jgi:hypothetical protein